MKTSKTLILSGSQTQKTAIAAQRKSNQQGIREAEQRNYFLDKNFSKKSQWFTVVRL